MPESERSALINQQLNRNSLRTPYVPSLATKGLMRVPDDYIETCGPTARDGVYVFFIFIKSPRETCRAFRGTDPSTDVIPTHYRRDTDVPFFLTASHFQALTHAHRAPLPNPRTVD